MPPKAAASDAAGTQKMVPADCVSVLLMAIGNTSIPKAQYDMMSALDGSRTASSFEHQFRSITAKAKELKARVDGGEKFEAVQPAKKRGAGAMGVDTPSTTPKKQKATPTKAKATPKSRGKKNKSSEEDTDGPSNDLADQSGIVTGKIETEQFENDDEFDNLI